MYTPRHREILDIARARTSWVTQPNRRSRRVLAGLALTLIATGAASPGMASAAPAAGMPTSAYQAFGHQMTAVTAHTDHIMVNGLPVAYRSFGQGPVLLLTPCLGLSMDDWDPALLDSLAAHHRVIIFDSDGVGRTPASTSAHLNVGQLSEQVSGLITALGLHSPTVAGYSLGGFVAQRLAVDHPGQVGALILMGTSPGGPTEVLPDLTANAALLDFTVPADQLFPLYFSGHPRDLTAWQQRISARRHRVEVALPGLNRQREALIGWLTDPTANVADKLPNLRVPTLVLGASDDEQQPAANSTFLAATIPGAHLKIYPRLSHAFPFEEPHRVAADITDFTNHNQRVKSATKSVG